MLVQCESHFVVVVVAVVDVTSLMALEIKMQEYFFD